MIESATLSPKQIQSIREAEARINLWEGSVRSGKTVASILAWLDYVRTGPPGPLAMIGKTKDTIGRNVIDPMQEMFGPLGTAAVEYTRGAATCRILGRLCHVLGAHDARSEGRIRGLTLAGAYVDEASLVEEAFWKQLTYRLSVPGSKLFATTNPDSPAHWLKRSWIDRAADLNLATWHFVLADNPGLTADYIAQLEAENVGLWHKRFIEGLWVAAEGAIYDMLDLDTGGRHRTSWDRLPILTGTYWLGVDYGTQNPFHAVLIGAGVDDRLYVVGEWRYDGRAQRRQLDPGQYEQRLKAWLDGGAGITFSGKPAVEVWPARTAVDPSAAEFRATLRNRGWAGLVAADNSVTDGIMAVSALLAAGRLVFVDGAAPELERELLGYVWDPKLQEKGEDAPLKQDDHGPDALRYDVQVCRSVWRPWLGSVAA